MASLSYDQLISYGITMIFLFVFLLTKNETATALKRKLFTGKGWITIRMFMPDRQEKEAFVNLKKSPTVEFFGRTYIYDAKSATFKSEIENKDKKNVSDKNQIDTFNLLQSKMTLQGKFPVFNFRWDMSEPVDPYEITKSFDSSMISAAIIRAKAQSGLKDLLGQNKKMMLYVIVIAGCAAAAAYFGYENSQTLQAIAARGVGLP